MTRIVLVLALFMLSTSSFSQRSDSPQVEHLTGAGVLPAEPALPFSDGVRVGNIVFLSGMIGIRPGTMELVPGGIEAEPRQTMENIAATLDAHGLTLADVVKCTVMIEDIAEWGAFNSVYAKFFVAPYPARSAFGAEGLALGARVEVECVAVASAQSNPEIPAQAVQPQPPDGWVITPEKRSLDSIPVEVLAPGITRQVVHGTQSTFSRWQLSAGSSVPLHHHVNEQMTWIISGSAEVVSGGKMHELRAGEIMVFAPNVEHAFTILEDTVAIDFFSPARQDWIDAAGDEHEIRAAIAEWVAIYNRNDWSALANQFTEDAVMMPPNAPGVSGRAAIAAWEAENEAGFRIALRPDDISIVGDRAIIHGLSCVFIPLEDGAIGVDIGKFLEVRRRQPDGRWLVAQDVFNSDLAAGAELAKACPLEIAGDAQ